MAFIGHEFICGIEVLPMAYTHLQLLIATDNPFVVGGAITLDHIGLFLWCVSPEYSAVMPVYDVIAPWFPGFAKRFLRRQHRKFDERVAKRIGNVAYLDAVKEITDYVEEAFLDAPGGNSASGNTIPYFSGIAATVVHVGLRLHWTEKAILRLPLKRLWQYLKAIEMETMPNPVLWNPSDAVRRRATDEMNGIKRNCN